MAGKFAGSDFTLFLVDAYNLIASLTEAVTLDRESVTQQTNPFGVTSEGHTPINILKGMLTVGGGVFDPTTDALHNVIGSVIGISRQVSVAYGGNTIGRPFTGYQGAYSHKYTVMDKRDGLTMADASYEVDGAIDEGVIVFNLTAVTADLVPPTGDTPVDYTTDSSQVPVVITSCSKANPGVVTTPVAHRLTTGQKILASGNSLSGPAINTTLTVTVLTTTTFSIGVDTTASSGAGTGGAFVLVNSVAGGVAYLHCTAFNGFTGFVAKVVHSPDDSTYATLITFTNLTAIGKERKTTAVTVDRYLSANLDVTGSGSVTPFIGFCRN